MKQTTYQNASTFNLILFLLLALFWSGSFLNIKIVVDVFPPVFSAMVRVLISFICLGLFFISTRKIIFIRSLNVWRLWVAGIFSQFLPFALLFYGEKFIEPALASIINSTVSLWALLLGAFMYRDFAQFSPAKIAGLILGFAGITIIFLPLIHQGENSILGISAIMGMSISYAIGSVISQHMIFKRMSVSFETNLFQQHFASLVFLILTSLSLETWPTLPSLFEPRVLFAFLYLGIVATAIAWVIYFYLIREWGAVRATSVMYIVPVLAILWDLLFLGLTPSTNEMLGTICILLGVTLIQWVRKSNVQQLQNGVS